MDAEFGQMKLTVRRSASAGILFREETPGVHIHPATVELVITDNVIRDTCERDGRTQPVAPYREAPPKTSESVIIRIG